MKKYKFTFKDFANSFATSIILALVFVLLLQAWPNSSLFVERAHPSLLFVLTYIFQFAVLFFPLWFFVIDKNNLSFKDFGLKKMPFKKSLKDLAIVIGYYILYIVFFSILVSLLPIEIPGTAEQDSYLPFFGMDIWGLIVGALFIVFIGPILEEIYFRGFIYKVFSNTWSPILASGLSAVLFSLVHAQIQNFLLLFVIGLFLNYAYRKSGSLVTPMLFHILNNAVAFSYTVYMASKADLLLL